MNYFAAVASPKGHGWTEVLVTRENGRMTQTETGVVYKSTKAMKAALAAKNR
jgi:hypothetical protein